MGRGREREKEREKENKYSVPSGGDRRRERRTSGGVLLFVRFVFRCSLQTKKNDDEFSTSNYFEHN